MQSKKQNDEGTALLVLDKYRQYFRYVPETKEWAGWDGTKWHLDREIHIYRMVIDTLNGQIAAVEEDLSAEADDVNVLKVRLRHLIRGQNHRKVMDVIKALQNIPEVSRSVAGFDADPNLLGAGPLEIDLRTGEAVASRPGSWITKKIGTEFNLDARAEKWVAFLEAIFQGDAELIRWIQKAVGYSLTGDVDEQMMFICVGDGANGKSTFLEVLKAILGDYAATASSNSFSAASKSEQTNDIARLKGKRFVTISESEEDTYLAESKIKAITGGEAVTARFLFREFFEFVPQFKVWMAVNREPMIRGADFGIKRRVALVPFNRRFEAGEQIMDLKEQLLAEGPGILNWALEGLKMWREEGLKRDIPGKIAQANQEFGESSDMLEKWLQEAVESAGPEDFVRAKELYMSYNQWMRDTGLRPKGITQWGRDMRGRMVDGKVLEKRRDGKGEKYYGVSFVQDWDRLADSVGVREFGYKKGE